MRIGIIGGGPGGSVTAAALAKRGHEVHLFESETFPRFRVGESLLPCNDPIFADIGLSQAHIADHGFMPKTGAFFEEAGSGRSVRFPFSDGLPGDPQTIFQVERSRFDHLLLTNAERHGAHLHTPVRIRHVDLSGMRPVLRHDHDAMEVDFVVDASGRATLLARQLSLVDHGRETVRAAVYGHVSDLPLVAGAAPGDLVISRGVDCWAWQIPLTPHQWSVGLVVPGGDLIGGGGSAALFARNLARFPELEARIGAQRPDPLRATPSMCYTTRQRCGRRWALVGDAAGFLDPILSSGVLLATRAGWQLAQALDAGGPDADLDAWHAATEHDLAIFRGFIRLWYDGDFISQAFFSGQRDADLHRGIISLLAGNTTHLDNRFLAMLVRKDSVRRRTMPHMN